MTATYDGQYGNHDAIRELKAHYRTRLQALQGTSDYSSYTNDGTFDGDGETGVETTSWSENTRNNATDAVHRGGRFLKANPTLVIGGALTLGFLLGAYLGRRSGK